MGLLSFLLGGNDYEGHWERTGTGGSAHPEYQACSLRCVSCGSRVAKSNPYLTDRPVLLQHVESYTQSGGKLSCGGCNVNHANFCVHGYLLERECDYCPSDGRIENLWDLKQSRD